MKNTLNSLILFCLYTLATSDTLKNNSALINRSKRAAIISNSILDEPVCAEIKTFCNNFSENSDLLILECLLSRSPVELSRLNDKCQNIIWKHTASIISDDNVKKVLNPVCPDLSKLNCQDDSYGGGFLKCVVNNREEINDINCSNMVMRLENVAFQDYRWIQNFINSCTSDIEKLRCGKIDAGSFSQLETVACLQNNIAVINDNCKNEVFKLSELQAENIRLDRQFYLGCTEDHTRYCRMFAPGSGRVFSCLMEISPDKLTSVCRKNLLRRQKLIVQDYRVSKGLMRACRDDIKKSQCRKHTNGDKNTRLAQVLLCLETVSKNGTLLDPDCKIEMVEHRKLLLEDYRLSPEIVDGCKDEIKQLCLGIETGGKTIHCLMDKARLSKGGKKKVSDICQRALEQLVKETDVGEDWRVDPVLHQACGPVVKTTCSDIRDGDARVMNCLMDNINADHMLEECRDALIQIQYFVARDFKLDPQLYRACKEDAQKLCHAEKAWDDRSYPDPTYGPQILPCLYRYAYHNDVDLKLGKACLQQVRRVMRQRAVSVDLQPEIEEPCLEDLAEFCVDKTKKGEEIICLQNNFDDLNAKCQDAVEIYTEAIGEHADLNPYIMNYCRRELELHCKQELSNDEGNVMECLVSHKNDPDVKANNKCHISIEHYQIISLKNYKFSYKFKVACKNYAMRFCAHSKNKQQVITCLSEKVTNDTISERKSDISKECRQQIKSQLFQQRENIDYDPKLKKACSPDIEKFCSKVEHGNAQVLECLQAAHDKLTPKCEQEVFKVMEQEMTDNSLDYALNNMCADAIEQFCPHYEKKNILQCLKMNKDEKGFNKKCRLIVMHRLIEQSSNYLLNPSLQENCKPDIKKFCFNILQSNTQGKDINNNVIKCLKATFKHTKLSNKCEKEMASILREQALDVNLNPLLRAVCKYELETICKIDDEDGGKAEECLKTALIEKRIPTPECKEEVANMIVESKVDIEVDPILQQACSLDLLKLCSDVPAGNGRHVKCLKIILDRDSNSLTPDCRKMLSKRLEMYKNAAQYAPPQDLQELYNQVALSPAKHYFFLMIFMFFGSALVIGIFFGRTTKRHMLLKNK